MKPNRFLQLIIAFLLFTQTLPAQETGIKVTNTYGAWTIAGKKQIVTFKEADLSIRIKAGNANWNMVPSGANDMIVKSNGKEFTVRLADAGKKKVTPYDPGFKSGIMITLENWKGTDCRLYLTLALEGPEEDLVFDVAAEEKQTVIRQLNWPTALDASDIDHTVLSNVRGVLLPRTWPKAYHPIRTSEPDGSIKKTDRSELQSNVIEDWSMSWWGFQKGKSAMMIIIETPNDAAYQFNHPAGGPTVIGPRWRASLGKLAYPRTGRMCFISEGTYVQMAKRYRKYAIETGLFVPLTEKIAKNPQVKQVIGTPIIRSGILTNYKEGGARWKRDSATRYRLTTFDQRAEEFRQWKQKGLNNLMVVLTGWPKLGYDRQHPDVLPPAPAAGGYEGMKRLQNTLKELGYLFVLHDQYRDYYVDAPSFNKQFAIHEEDSISPPNIFPGTRFGDYKKGRIPYMDYWDGGRMSYLSGKFMPGHVKKNYQGLFDQGIHPNGSYMDVFGYVPPDEDFNPQHPSTRTDALRDRIQVYHWVRANLGIVGTETACDWTVPYVDFSSPLSARNGITIPLWDLVYHEAILTTYNPADLRGLLNAGLPQIGRGFEVNKENLDLIKRMSELNKRLAFTEMIQHEFLDADYKKERTVFADGTSIMVDWDKKTVEIKSDSSFRVSSNFESGSARVLAIDPPTQTVQIAPAGDPSRGMPNWWYVKIDGINVQQPVILEVQAREDLVRDELTGQGKKIASAWAWPAQAALSYDGKTWKQTAAGERGDNKMIYRVQPTAGTLWLAWGPPFTPTDALTFVEKISGAHAFAKAFTLCQSREGRQVPALHILEGNKPLKQRPAIWVHARQHAWECGGSWVGVGFIEWLVSDQQQAKWLRQNADIYFVPVMDVDHVATGDGGKLAHPQDHNLDWSDQPYYSEVAAAQKHILALAKEGRMNIFLDLHNPAPGNKQQTAYVIEKEYISVKAEPRKLRFVELMIDEFGVLKQNPAKPPVENPAKFHQVSVPWVLEHANPHTIAFCIETPWNTPSGTPEGYRAVGQKLGSAVQKLLQEERK